MIPKQVNSRGFIFKIYCHGNTQLSHKVITLDQESFSTKYPDICHVNEVHKIRIAFNNLPNFWFSIDEETQTLEKYPLKLWTDDQFSAVAHDWEILETFFSNYHLQPTWINCNHVYGWIDPDTGNWTGAMGKVQGVWYEVAHFLEISAERATLLPDAL